MASSSSRRGKALGLLGERLQLGIATYRRARGLAVLAIRIHGPNGDAPPADVVEALDREVMNDVRDCLERVDTLTRVGPLSLFALLERADEGPFAVRSAERIIEVVRKPRRAGARDVQLAASIGISVHPDDGETVNDLVRGAEAAAHAAEVGGGNLFGFNSQPLNEAAARRSSLEKALAGALDRGEFHLHYQPQLDSRDGRLVGVEALLRFRHKRLGSVSPVEFVPVLESTGQIEQVGSWVVARACEQAAEWAAAGTPVRVGINVSAEQLRSRAFDTTVADALQDSGVSPSLVELELTESVLVENPVHTRALLEDLRGRGLRVAVDDFGTGYASLAYVRQFPMDTLKIDRQFVRGLPLDNEAAAITSAIIALARSLGLELVAEGVETEAEEEFLHSLECFVVQGFLHARPMEREALAAWRRARPWS